MYESVHETFRFFQLLSTTYWCMLTVRSNELARNELVTMGLEGLHFPEEQIILIIVPGHKYH